MAGRPGRELTIEERRQLDRYGDNDRRRRQAGATYSDRDRYLAQLNADGVSTRTLGEYLGRSAGTIGQAIRNGRRARPA